METKDLLLLAVTLVILGEVTYLLAKLPKTTINAKDRAILVDTSVLMDGRITMLAASGFIGGTLVIPRSVVGELQFLADHADSEKRMRARRGLDIVSELQQMDAVTVELLQDGSKADEGVDERLLTLAKQHKAAICTLDYNLNKVAVVEGIQVLNINELAQALRMAHLPGEAMTIDLVQKGQEAHQGVGYLLDGTMVVVEHANKLIGQSVRVEVVRSLQTNAGKMMFARPLTGKPDSAPAANNRSRQGQGGSTQTTSTAASNGTANGGRKPHANTRQDKPQRSVVSQPQTSSQPASQPPKRRTTRSQPRKRIDREAALMDLVEKQQ